MNQADIAPPTPGMTAKIAALAGLVWSLFGVFQFASQTFPDRDGLVAGGMTLAQATLYSELPLWMDGMFALGTLGGSLGCLLLLFARRMAVPVLGVSLAAYLALFVGDAVFGVFAAFGPPQVAVLSSVVLIAAALAWLARRLDQRGLLA